MYYRVKYYKASKFDAVEIMRAIRDDMTKRYSVNFTLEKIELEEIRKKYDIKQRVKDAITHDKIKD